MSCRLPKQGYTKGLHSSMLLKAQVAAVADNNPPPIAARQSVCCTRPLHSTRQSMTPSGTQYLLSKYANTPQRIFNPDFAETCGGIINNTQAIDPSVIAPVSGETAGYNVLSNNVTLQLPPTRASAEYQTRVLPFSVGIEVNSRQTQVHAGSRAIARKRELAAETVVLQPWQQPQVIPLLCPLPPYTQSGVPVAPLPPCLSIN